MTSFEDTHNAVYGSDPSTPKSIDYQTSPVRERSHSCCSIIQELKNDVEELKRKYKVCL